MTPWLDDGDVRLYHGDCVEAMRVMPEASVDAVVCDPPYGLAFMGKDWDDLGGVDARQPGDDDYTEGPGPYGRSKVRYGYGASARAQQDWHYAWATEALRVLKPGGHLVAFGGTRTYHRLACAIEDAGFEVRDSLCWLYGSGFPKSLDVSKAIDKAAGAEREQGTPGRYAARRPRDVARSSIFDGVGDAGSALVTEPATAAAAAAWTGWGTALKPAYEPIVLARKPLTGTVAANVQAHGTGALNIDACRIHTEGDPPLRWSQPRGGIWRTDADADADARGRWPANVALDETAAVLLDESVGPLGLAANKAVSVPTRSGAGSQVPNASRGPTSVYGDPGSASRFFYTAKASRSERGDENTHPTVKPVALMRWLCRLITPPGGVILDPFCGSGTTPLAARLEGFRCIAVDREEEYLRIAARRTAQLSLLAEGGVA